MFLRYKDYNIITFPKCGSTFLMKICMETEPEIYKNHNHTYKYDYDNKCNKFKSIYRCAYKTKNYDKNKPTIFVYRYPHERFASFYKSNYKGYVKNNNLSYTEFVDYVLENPTDIFTFEGHTKPISITLDACSHNFKHISNKKFIHLSEVNNFFLTNFNVDITKRKISNQTKSTNLNTLEIINKIKNNPLFKYDYEYFDNIK